MTNFVDVYDKSFNTLTVSDKQEMLKYEEVCDTRQIFFKVVYIDTDSHKGTTISIDQQSISLKSSLKDDVNILTLSKYKKMIILSNYNELVVAKITFNLEDVENSTCLFKNGYISLEDLTFILYSCESIKIKNSKL